MAAETLPPREPLRCRLGLHRWSGWFLRPVHHTGEYPWDTWQHVCLGKAHSCVKCGVTRRSKVHSRCVGSTVVPLKAQPYSPTRAELREASRVLLED